MSNLIDGFGARRLLLIAAALGMVAMIACGAEASGGTAAGANQADDPPAATEDVSAAGDAPGSGEDEAEAATAPGGIDQDCVQQVLGREASGFGDITAAERDRIFSECSGDDGGRPPRVGADGNRDFQFGGGALAAINPECVQGIVGGDGGDDGGFAQITPEQRRQIFTECGDGDGGGFLGGDGFAGQLPDCFTDALGDSPNGLQGLSREDFQAIAEACGDEFGGVGGFGGAGQDGGGFFGRGGDGGAGGDGGGGGFGGGLDLNSECVTQALGRSVDSLQDLSAQERQQLFQTCFGGGGQ